MDKKSLILTVLVEQTPKEVFEAIQNVPAWWHAGMKGNSQKLNDEFSVQFKDIHYSKHQLTAVIPNEKMVWLTLDSKLTFVDKQKEWTGTSVIFEISQKGKQTELKFTHDGLIPAFECYEGCSSGWNYFIKDSLIPFIETGKGKPEPKE